MSGMLIHYQLCSLVVSSAIDWRGLRQVSYGGYTHALTGWCLSTCPHHSIVYDSREFTTHDLFNPPPLVCGLVTLIYR